MQVKGLIAIATMVVVCRSCKDCNGSGICVHGKLKRSCKECSTDMCEHKRRRYYCRDCGGAGHAIFSLFLIFSLSEDSLVVRDGKDDE